jgi:hypothetical protein
MLKNQEYKITILLSANESLEKISEFTSRVSVQYELKVYTAITNDIERLRYFPDRFQKFQSKKFPEKIFHKCFSAKYYWIVFEIIENNVYIYDIIDCRRNPDNNYV